MELRPSSVRRRSCTVSIVFSTDRGEKVTPKGVPHWDSVFSLFEIEIYLDPTSNVPYIIKLTFYIDKNGELHPSPVKGSYWSVQYLE